MKKRLLWLDVAKGFAVLLVVLGHCILQLDSENKIERYILVLINTFHVPLLFCLSGYVLKCEPDKNFIPKRWRQLLIPYFVFCVIELIFNVSVAAMQHTMSEMLLSYKNNFSNTILFTWKSSFSRYWFLHVLFFSNLLVFYIERYTHDELAKLMISTGGVVLSRLLCAYFPYDYFSINEVLLAQFFVYCGMNMRKREIIPTESFSYGLLCSSGLLLWLGIVGSLGKGVVGFYCSSIPDVFLMMTCSLSATVFISEFMFLITQKNNKVIFWFGNVIGRHTLLIYGLHYIVLDCLKPFFEQIEVTNTFLTLFRTMGYCLTSLVLVILIITVFEKAKSISGWQKANKLRRFTTQ